MNAKQQAFFQQLVNQCFWEVQQHSPIDTGNLRYNAIKLTKEGDNYVIYVDTVVAPYMVYTNEPWRNGRQNPNERWFDKVAELVAKKIASALGGKLTERK